MAHAIGGHLQAVFEEGDAPTRSYYEPERAGLEFQMAIPGECNENIRTKE